MVKDKSIYSRLFDAANYTFLFLFAVAAILPFIHVIGASFASVEELAKSRLLLIPSKPTLLAYMHIFETKTLSRSMSVTIYITVIGTVFNLIFTSIMAYALAHNELYGRRVFMFMVTFTLLFNGGLVPGYLLVKQLGMVNSLWSLIIPGAISPFNLIVMKNFFQSIPKELEESAMMDGATDFTVFGRIVLPLSGPALATFSLFYAVGHWNTFFSALMYINDTKKWPLQVLLRQIVILADAKMVQSDTDSVFIPPENIKYAVITFATFPILLVYPLLQKHFTKGAMLGSVKG